MKRILLAMALACATAPAFADERMVTVSTDAAPGVVVDRLQRAMIAICGREPMNSELLRTQLYRDCVASLKRAPEVRPEAWAAALDRM